MDIELTKSQKESVEYDAGDLLVKGVPGSGKSVVLMQRALRFNKKAIEAGETKKILILAFTKSLVKYTSELVDMTGLSPCMIQINTIDKVCRDLFLKMTNKKFVYMISKADERQAFVERAVQRHLEKKQKKHRFHDIDADFWAAEFLWIKQKNIKTKDQYIDTERVGRGGKIRMTKEDKSVAYELFEEYCDLLKQANKYDWEDLYTYLIANANRIRDVDKYDYVLVDEAQDLSYAKLKVAKLLTRRTITIAADKAQKIYSTSFSWKEIGIDIRGRASKSLETTFRSTKQIVQLAESLLEVNRALQDDQSEYTDPVLPVRDGEIPRVISCKNAAAEQEIVIGIIRKYLGKNAVIGVLYRSKPEYVVIKKWLWGAGISYEEIQKDSEWSLNTPGVKVSTLHSSKGLEFDVVLIPKFNHSIFPLESVIDGADDEQVAEIRAQERSLLYVGMTRAKYDLYLTFSGTPSAYLTDFEPEYYKYCSSEGVLLPKPKRLFVPHQDKNNNKQAQSVAIPQKMVSAAPKTVRNTSQIQVHEIGHNEKRFFKINTHAYPQQNVLIGKAVGDSVKILGTTFVIDKIE